MSKTEFRKFLKTSIEKKALQYLLEKRGSKGSEIQYSNLKMAEYLSPNYEQLSLNDQRYIFAIRNRMIEIEHNIRKQLLEERCICGEQQTQKHIYLCENEDNNIRCLPYERIFEDNVNIQKQIYLRFKKNYEIRKNKVKHSPLDPYIGRSELCNSTAMDFKKKIK